jgi:hypothetical protein
MRLFICQHCRQLLYFENRQCETCGHVLGYLPERGVLSALEPEPDSDRWLTLAKPRQTVRFCANAGNDGCNWLLSADSGDTFCAACRHNRTIPDLSQGDNLAAWRKLELALHRLFYTLLKLRLPLADRRQNPQHGLVFDILADPPAPQGPKVLTGHDEGLITLALTEADDAMREQRRQAMGEPYRTLLGHLRHEIGHYFWDVLVRDGGRLDECRALFGDDSQDYEAALQAHYANGAPADWQDRFISAYASTHPWEDFAETWAHYLHIVDTLETAGAFGVKVAPQLDESGDLSATNEVDPYTERDIDTMIDDWLPLTFAVNNMNRSMGQPDLYPFILSKPAIAKLGFIHDLVRAGRPAQAPSTQAQATRTEPAPG